MKNNLLILITFVSLMFGVSCANGESRTTIADSADEVHPLLVGQSVPAVNLWTGSGKPIAVSKLVAAKPTVLIFYRGGWCPFCNHQLAELQSIEAELTQLGYQILAVSPELPDKLKQMQSERNLSYQLLSDFRIEAARAFGLAFRVDNSITALVKTRYGADLQRFEGEQQANLPVPAVYIIDQQGVIQFSYINPNYQVRLHPELLLTAAKVALKGENVRLKR